MGFTAMLVMMWSAAGAGQIMDTVDDAAITTKIESRFMLNDDIKAMSITTSTEAGVVTLKGSVHDASQKKLAEDIARAVPGVQDVKNELIIVPTSYSEADTRGFGQRTRDWSTKVNIKGLLLREGEFKGLRIDVQVVNGTVTLSGVVKSDAQKERIARIVAESRGVTQVINNLIVLPKEAAENMQDVGGHFGDEWLEKRVERAILVNRDISKQEVDVEVNDGVCLLYGSVDSQAEKDLAEQLARSVDGLSEIKNDIQIRPDATTPAPVEKPVERAIEEPVDLAPPVPQNTEVIIEPLDPVDDEL